MNHKRLPLATPIPHGGNIRYVLRTGEPAERLSAPDTVRGYKGLGQVEQGFRCLKRIDIRVRPIHHCEERRVRAHVFLCLLAYYVEWHMRQALHPLLFDEEELAERRGRRNPVARAEPSAWALRKKRQRTTAEGSVVHSFDTLLAELGTLCRHRCRIAAVPPSDSLGGQRPSRGGRGSSRRGRRSTPETPPGAGRTSLPEIPPPTFPTILQETPPTPWQARVFELLGL